MHCFSSLLFADTIDAIFSIPKYWKLSNFSNLKLLSMKSSAQGFIPNIFGSSEEEEVIS